MLAKFRGIEFHVKDIDYGRGIKTAEASFLADDDKSQITEFDNIDFKINGFIYGSNVENIKRKLEAALNQKKGLLLLPDGRSAQVKIDEGSWRILADDENEGYYKLELNFKKIDADSLSLKIIELKEIDEEKVVGELTEAQKKILEMFKKIFSYDGFPNFVKMQSFDSITSIAGKLSKLTADNLIGKVTNPFTGSLDILAASAGGIGSALMSYVNFRDLFGNDKDYFDAYINAANLSSDVTYPDITDESLLQVYYNSKAVEQLVTQEALIQAVSEASTKKEFNNEKQIENAVEILSKTAEKVIYDCEDIVLQNQLFKLVNLGISLIRKKHAAKTKIISFNKSLPAVVIAYSLYGSEALEKNTESLVQRNEITHALFCPAGKSLEVEDV